MSRNKRTTSSKLKTVGIAAAAVVALGIAAPVAASAATPATVHATAAATAKPTIVLVHGAWADASSFSKVTAVLQHDGYKVLNAPNPLRGLASDSANVAAFVNQNTTGPVVLVGHSYGGSVITDAGTSTPTVKALGYVDAFAPAEGESAIQLTGTLPGSDLAVADPSTVFNFVQYPGAATGDVDTYIKPALFRKIVAARLSATTANVLAASESPIALSALKDPSTAPAWATIKSFFFVGTTDKVIPEAEQLAMAKRAGGFIEKYKADHLSMLEAPVHIADLIEKAAK
jgi:pimeloyl-ACP methyl ester carboxylesterase